MKENTWKSGSTYLRIVHHSHRNSFGDTFPYPMSSVMAIHDYALVRCPTEAVSQKLFLLYDLQS